jgi:hypothetical protein
MVGKQKNMVLFLLGFGTFLTLSQTINVGAKYLTMALTPMPSVVYLFIFWVFT